MPDEPESTTEEGVGGVFGDMPKGDVFSLFGVDPQETGGEEDQSAFVESPPPVPGQRAEPSELVEVNPETGEPVWSQRDRLGLPQEDESGEGEGGEEGSEGLSALDKVMGHLEAETAPAEGEAKSDEALRLELAEMRGRLDQNIADTEARLRDLSTPEVPTTPEKTYEVDYESEEIQRILRTAAEDPGQMGTAIREIARREAKALVAPELENIKAKQEADAQANALRDEKSTISNQMDLGLKQAYALGDLEADIVTQAHQLGNRSLLFEHLVKNPTQALTAQGIVSATMAVARSVQRAADALDARGELETEPVTEAPAKTPVVERRSTPKSSSANRRGNQLLQPKGDQLSPGDRLKREIMGAQASGGEDIPWLSGNVELED